MRILFLHDFFPPNEKGGAGVVASRLAHAISKDHTVSVVTTTQNKEDVGKEADGEITVYKIYSDYHERWRAYKSLYNPATVANIQDIIDSLQPDIVHAHNIHQHLSYHSLFMAKKNGAKVVMTFHDAMSVAYGKLIPKKTKGTTEKHKLSFWDHIKAAKKRYNPLRNTIIRYYLNNFVDRKVAVSNALAQALQVNGIKDVGVVHNGVDIDKWEVGGGEVEKFIKKYDLKGKKIVLFGGRLSALKGKDVMIQAMNEVVKNIPAARLVVMGVDSVESNDLTSNLKDRLVPTGWISGNELRAAYNVADVVCVPSIYLDPFPTINIEAMASATSVIGTCYGGTPEAVADNKTGYIINPKKISLFSSKMCNLLKCEPKRDRFAENARKRVKKHFSLEEQVGKILDTYTI